MGDHKYQSTLRGVMEWANSELEHVGRIVAVEDPDVQYAYALSTVNGMLHLRQALSELIEDNDYHMHQKDLQKTHNGVVRVIKHLIKDFNIDIGTIKNFNTRQVLGNMDFLNETNIAKLPAKNKNTKRTKASESNTRKKNKQN